MLLQQVWHRSADWQQAGQRGRKVGLCGKLFDLDGLRLRLACNGRGACRAGLHEMTCAQSDGDKRNGKGEAALQVHQDHSTSINA
ncbi:hypothetical protein ACFSHQ_07500 [Gemmobacter lanyuensis]